MVLPFNNFLHFKASYLVAQFVYFNDNIIIPAFWDLFTTKFYGWGGGGLKNTGPLYQYLPKFGPDIQVTFICRFNNIEVHLGDLYNVIRRLYMLLYMVCMAARFDYIYCMEFWVRSHRIKHAEDRQTNLSGYQEFGPVIRPYINTGRDARPGMPGQLSHRFRRGFR